jgi:hypothetical protein
MAELLVFSNDGPALGKSLQTINCFGEAVELRERTFRRVGLHENQRFFRLFEMLHELCWIAPECDHGLTVFFYVEHEDLAPQCSTFKGAIEEWGSDPPFARNKTANGGCPELRWLRRRDSPGFPRVLHPPAPKVKARRPALQSQKQLLTLCHSPWSDMLGWVS